ncbi:MAG: STAS domain-containing protein [bacterium]|nr:STAS domain-containing protein [bacterium]
MSKQMLTLKTEQHGRVIIVYIKGVCNLETSGQLNLLLQAQLGKGACTIALNCNELEVIDSTAVGGLIRFLKDARLNNINLVFYDLTVYMARIFRRTFWDELFEVKSKEDFEKEYLKTGHGD